MAVILLLIIPVLAESKTVNPGETVYIGDSGLDITPALGNYSTIAWWPEGSDIRSSAPSAIVNVTENAALFSVDSSVFSEKIGSWYQYDPSIPYKVGSMVFIVDMPLAVVTTPNQEKTPVIESSTLEKPDYIRPERILLTPADRQKILANAKKTSGNQVIIQDLEDFLNRWNKKLNWGFSSEKISYFNRTLSESLIKKYPIDFGEQSLDIPDMATFCLEIGDAIGLSKEQSQEFAVAADDELMNSKLAFDTPLQKPVTVQKSVQGRTLATATDSDQGRSTNESAPNAFGVVVYELIFVDFTEVKPGSVPLFVSPKWTTAHMQDATADAVVGIDAIAPQAPAQATMSSIIEYWSPVQITGVDDSATALEPDGWMEQVFRNLGVVDENFDGRVTDDYARKVKRDNNADRVVLIYLTHDWEGGYAGSTWWGDADKAAISYWGRGDNNLPFNSVPGSYEHEIIHLFGALDEYTPSSTCGESSIFATYPMSVMYWNTNHDTCIPHTPSVMKELYTTSVISQSSRNLIGWGDYDNDGVIDVIDGIPFGSSPTPTPTIPAQPVPQVSYSVSQTSSDPAPAYLSASDSLTAAASASTSSSLTYQFVDTSTNIPTSFIWYFGDGGISTEKNPSHTYPSAGTYTVTHYAMNGFGSGQVTRNEIIVGSNPVPPSCTPSGIPQADFEMSGSEGIVPYTVHFTDKSTGCPAEYHWDFGDPNEPALRFSTEQNPTYTYKVQMNPTQPYYTVNLIVKNQNGDSTVKSKQIKVMPPYPLARFTANPTTGDAPLAVHFTDTNYGAPAVIRWDFGDNGAISYEQNPTHLYETGGDYTATQFATNNYGTHSAFQTIHVEKNDVPSASFTVNSTSGLSPLTVRFTDTSTNSPVQWSWDFGDNSSPSSEQNPTHTYTSLGSFAVTLVSTDTNGVSSTKRIPDYITVSNIPVINGAVWTRAVTAASWAARSNPASLVFNDKMWVLGGYDYTNGWANDVWSSSDGVTWSQATGNAAWTKRTKHATAVHNNKMWVVGGSDYIGQGTLKNDVWSSSDGVTWTQATGSAAWTPRMDHALVSFNNKLWMLGGYDWTYNRKNDVWSSSDGATWSQATASAAWSGRQSFKTLVFNNKIWVLGGETGSGYANDVWSSSDGIIWTRVMATAPWSARREFGATVFDNKMWIFGGYSNAGYLNDVWSSPDGITWTQATAHADWPFRSRPGSVTFKNTIWVLGGEGGNGRNDVWYAGTPPAITPIAAFSANRTSGTTPLTIQFTDNSTNAPTTWYWDFGDSSDSTVQNPVHVYSSPGNFTVSLRSANAGGSNTTVRTSYIQATSPVNPPVAAFIANSTQGPVPLAVQFTDTSSNTPLVWSWNFGDGTTSALQNPVHIYNAEGTYTVTLTAGNAGGNNTITGTNFITVNPPKPVAKFQASTTTGPFPLAVQFNDTSSNFPTSWNWDFGDGVTSTLQHPLHTYTTPGTYSVTLVATNAGGSGTISSPNHITVITPPPVADFDADTTTGIAPLTVQFTDATTNAPTLWSWNFGDGTTSVDQNPQHVFTAPGTYSVNLTAANAGGSSSVSKPDLIVVQPPAPVAGFTADNVSGMAPLSVQFTDTSSNTPAAWSWNFGDGSTSTVQNPLHIYNTTGTYTVSLTVTNAGGSNTVTQSNYISVSPVTPTPTMIPVAALSANRTAGETPMGVQFYDRSTGTPTAWLWDFGDGSTSTSRNPVHTFTTAGNFTINLTATNAYGSGSKIQVNYIKPSVPVIPTAAFRGNITAGPTPLAVQFTDRSTGYPKSWSWDFGDGTTSTVRSPLHTYSAAGNYTVTLTVTNAQGSNTAVQAGYIKPAVPVIPTAAFRGNITAGPTPLAVQFTDRSTG
ncbi:MAG: PKD domain-containing protein, partial [Methanomicrobiales archaeon]|nr:PKD domain-containing protein [Methanomicrobiales archaeon]